MILKKPCKGCPFRSDAPHGLWEASHYLLTAYLGSANVYGIPKMGCHKFNKRLVPDLPDKERPFCAGWLIAADNISARMAIMSQRYRPEVEANSTILSPEDMARANGLNMDMLPPLHYDYQNKDGRFPTQQAWEDEVNRLRDLLSEQPSAALTFIVPGSPLDVRRDKPYTREELVSMIGEKFARTYHDGKTDDLDAYLRMNHPDLHGG